MSSVSPDSSLELSLLGGFDARLNGQSVSGFSYQKMRALLAYLAVERGKNHRREVLAELLWSDNDATAARDNLRRTLSNLRVTLKSPTSKDWFASSKHTICLIPEARTDVQNFSAAAPSCVTPPALSNCSPCLEQMEYQAGLYRGEFMAGIALPDCPDFEGWLQLQREALHLRAVALLEKLANCHEQMGAYNKALQFALRHTELEPWDENAHRCVMRLYALNGQHSAALAQYDTCSKLLKKELGVLPDGETQQLAEHIRASQLKEKRRDGRTDTRVGDRRSRDISKSLSTPMPMPVERRQATVLYCEISHSGTEDIDEVMALLQIPQAHCAEIIRQYCGHLVQTHGGGLLAYFGYPQARENAAYLAVQAALTVTREAGCGIEIRVGVHTGTIITGGDISLPDMVGKTSRLAIELRQIARPGEVVISQETQKLVEGYFDCTELPAHSISGMSRSAKIFRAIRESGARTRLGAAAQLTPLVGRKSEISRLAKLWKQVKQGESHVVLVEGEAGIGKSRLLHALKQRLGKMPYAIRESSCFPESSQSPFHPLIMVFESLFGFAHNNTPEQKFGKLAQYIETHYPATAEEAVPLLALLFSLPPGGFYRVPSLPPQQQKEQTIAVLLKLMRALSAKQPVLLIIEDLHWIDPSSLELLTRFVEQENNTAILTLLTARPEFVPPWNESGKTRMMLSPLDSDDAAKMLLSINANIPIVALPSIVARSDGVPLFIEEMAKIATNDSQTAVPATLHDVLAARMDQTGEAKQTAQIAASIGREFDLVLLGKLVSDQVKLERNLYTLLDAGLILPVNATTCQFKHALIQETAYQSQTLPDRQAVHGRIAQVLRSDFPDIVATQPELLAQHLSAAGETWHAIEFWLKAGQRASRNSANLETVGHYMSALQLLTTLPEDMARNRTESAVLINLCPVLYATKGYGSEQATQANLRLSALGERVGDSPELFLAQWALAMNTIAGIGPRNVPGIALRLFDMSHGDPLRELAAHYAVADAAFWLGDFETTRIHTEQAVTLYHPTQHLRLLELYNEDLSVSCAAYLSWSLYFLGYPDRARQVCDQMLGQARELNHPHTLALALCFASVLHRWLKLEQTLSLSAETVAVSRQHNFSVWLAAGEMTHGWALSMYGMKEGIVELKSSIAGMKAAIGGISVVFLSALIEAYVQMEIYDEALTLIIEAQAEVIRTGDGHYTAELHRLEGECLLALSSANAAQAETCFEQALVISNRQGAKSLELRATTSMAKLWQQQGKHADARRLLENVYGKFTEGYDTPDLLGAANILAR